jgi:hypothetical protein
VNSFTGTGETREINKRKKHINGRKEIKYNVEKETV